MPNHICFYNIIHELQLDHNQMVFVIVVMFINRIFIIGLFQSNQRSFYENEYVRNAAICVLVRIAQFVEHPAETDQLTFIKRHRAFESHKLLLLFSFLCIYNFFFFHRSMFVFLLYVNFYFL